MALQYQYQYQYQMQYQSFYQMLQDVPYKIPLISLVIAILPFLIYYLFKKSYITRILAYPYSLFSVIKTYLENKKFKERVEYEYNYLIRKKESKGKRLIPIAGFLVTALLAVLIIKKVVFLGMVVSGSMMPTLMPVDLVLFERITLNNINRGDIVTFTPPGGATQIVHRVVRVDDGKYRTMGDNVGTIDDWVLTREDIAGKAVRFDGRPIVVKDLGWYFMPLGRTYIPGTDPAYEFVKVVVQTVHQQGPVVLIIIILLMVVGNFGKKKYRYDISG
ncbi:MAG: signal peptidase I [Candidatus Hydrothermarchaeales archaeon]